MSRFILLLCLLLPASAALAAGAADPARADALLKARDPGAAAEVAALLKARPDDPAVRVLQVRLLIQQGKSEDAVDAAEEFADDLPDSALAHLWLGNAYGNRIGQLGTFGQGLMAPKLRRAFERAVELDPDQHEARSALVEFYLMAPGIIGGSVDNARAQAAELQRRDPPRGQYALGRIAQQEERLEEAARHYVAAYEGRPDNDMYRMTVGIVHQQAEAWDAAFAHFGAWTSEKPDASAAWYQLGRTAVVSGQRLDEGAAAFRRFLALPERPGQPEHKYGWWRLGQALAQAGDKAGAREALQRALALDPGLDEAKEALKQL